MLQIAGMSHTVLFFKKYNDFKLLCAGVKCEGSGFRSKSGQSPAIMRAVSRSNGRISGIPRETRFQLLYSMFISGYKTHSKWTDICTLRAKCMHRL